MTSAKTLIAKTIRDSLKIPHYRAFLFGSRVGNFSAPSRSDYDIGIEASSKIPLFILNDLRTKLENLPLLQKIDLIDFNQVGNEFKSIALQNIEILHEQ